MAAGKYQISQLFFYFCIFSYANIVTSLICLQKTTTDAQPKAVYCRNCSVCAVGVNGLNLSQSMSLFPLSADNEDPKPYDAFFTLGKKTNNLYKILTVCVMERYSFGETEYSFRCVCKENYCNDANKVLDFLANQVSTDMSTGEKMFKDGDYRR
uniref:Uncharacterized protein n=1 Tax=Romanomermis culicivorax TaxID=13658 RepID=A0A915IZZ0_ROMCU